MFHQLSTNAAGLERPAIASSVASPAAPAFCHFNFTKDVSLFYTILSKLSAPVFISSSPWSIE
jgi:hypothetical protein